MGCFYQSWCLVILHLFAIVSNIHGCLTYTTNTLPIKRPWRTIVLAPDKLPQGSPEAMTMTVTQALKKAAILDSEKANSMRRYQQWRQEDVDTSPIPYTVGNHTPAIGSVGTLKFPKQNVGFLSTVINSYIHHYNLRTSPEDWWYTIIQRVAVAIDENSKKDKVRKFFVPHEGKKELSVGVGDSIDIYGIDYSWFFDQMARKISENVNMPEYVRAMEMNFST